MTVTMQGKLMSVLMDLPDDVWKLFRGSSNQKERGPHLLFLQHLEQAARILRMRTIVKRQRDLGPGSCLHGIRRPDSGAAQDHTIDGAFFYNNRQPWKMPNKEPSGRIPLGL